MMDIRKGIISSFCLFSALISGGRLAAQVRTDSVEIDLPKAIEIALSDNPTIVVADREIEIKKVYRQEQIAALIPTVSASAQYSRNLLKQRIAIMGQVIEMGTDNIYQAGFNLQLPIIAPTLWQMVKMSDYDVMLAVEKARSSRLDMVNQVRKAYFQYLLARESLEVLQASYDNNQTNLKYIVDMYEQGRVSEYDKLTAEVQMNNIRPKIVSAKNAVYLAELQLKILLGMDVAETVRFTGNLEEYKVNMDREEMLALNMHVFSDTTSALQNNSMMKQLDIQFAQLQRARKLIQTTMCPTLGLGVNYGWTTMNDDFKIGSYLWFPNSAIGVSLNIPIFSGTKVLRQLKQNRLQQESMSLQIDDTERKLMLALQSALSNMNSSVEEIAYSEEAVAQAQKAYDLSSSRYSIGSGTILEVNDANIALLSARLSHSQSIFNFLSAFADLEMVLGRDYSADNTYSFK